jgi:hypothetical protein
VCAREALTRWSIVKLDERLPLGNGGQASLTFDHYLHKIVDAGESGGLTYELFVKTSRVTAAGITRPCLALHTGIRLGPSTALQI